MPNIAARASLEPNASFLGPQAENWKKLKSLIDGALDDIKLYRTAWRGGSSRDPTIEPGTDFQTLDECFSELQTFLSRYETPYSSMRYQAHMLSDNLLPAVVGYFRTMLQNPNNVTIQASTATTLLEFMVMHDLCRMFAFEGSAPSTGEGDDAKKKVPWAHATVDGSIANIEGLWSSRETKFIAPAVRAANCAKRFSPKPEVCKQIDELEIVLCDGKTKRKLGELTDWQQLNITRDVRLSLPSAIARVVYGDSPTDEQLRTIWDVVAKSSVNAHGWARFGPQPPSPLCVVAGYAKWPAILVPSTAHYSWPKAAAVTGLGTDGCLSVAVDEKGRMLLGRLDDVGKQGRGGATLVGRLNTAFFEGRPILLVVSVFGSTEEGAVDDLRGILNIRTCFRSTCGLDFDVHVDAAWGGYFVSCIRKPYDIDPLPRPAASAASNEKTAEADFPFTDGSDVPLNEHVIAQAQAIRSADSLTVDPHKMGYVQYPAGFVMYANGDAVNLTTFTGAYIGSTDVPAMGLFGLEGSRPGAAPTSVYLAHACLRPDNTGYGRIINLSLHNARQFYAHLLLMKSTKFKAITLTPLDEGLPPGFVDAVVNKSLDQIQRNPQLMSQYKKLGPDQNIVDYGFNPVGNTDPAKYNELCKKVYKALHVACEKPEPTPIKGMPLMISKTTFKREEYGDAFMDSFARRLGLSEGASELECLRSTVMSPFVADVHFWTPIGEIIRETVEKCLTTA